MALRKFRLASSRCSAGVVTEGELGSVVDWEREERPRVKRPRPGRGLGGWDIVMVEMGELVGMVR